MLSPDNAERGYRTTSFLWLRCRHAMKNLRYLGKKVSVFQLSEISLCFVKMVQATRWSTSDWFDATIHRCCQKCKHFLIVNEGCHKCFLSNLLTKSKHLLRTVSVIRWNSVIDGTCRCYSLKCNVPVLLVNQESLKMRWRTRIFSTVRKIFVREIRLYDWQLSRNRTTMRFSFYK